MKALMKAKEDLTVKDVIELLNAGTMTEAQVGKMYDRSYKTVRRILLKLGFTYDKKQYFESKDNIESTYDIKFITLLGLKTNENQKQSKKQSRITIKGVNKMDNTNKNESKIESNNKSKVESNSDFKSTLESLSKLASKKEGNGKKYRGFYFSEKTLKAIDDNVGSGNKSEFVDNALQSILKELGWLE